MNQFPEQLTEFPKKCVLCGKKVDYVTPGAQPENDGGTFGPCAKKPGNHQVEPKEYFHLGAVSVNDQRDRCKFAPLMILLASETIKDASTGRLQYTHGVEVQWESGGHLTTDDPEVQWYLDRRVAQHGDLVTGPEGLDAWRNVYLTEQQKVQQAKVDLAALEAQIKEGNRLLEQTKAQGKQKPHATV